jgi:cytochrome c-type biogenesis protein CcmH
MLRVFTIAAAATLVLAGAVATAASAAEPRATLPDIEDEVMCPTCGTALGLAFSPQAERQRQFIRRQIAQGKTKTQIKDALVAEFGPEVLALPDDEGFDLVAYLVPAGAVVLALAGVVVGVARWRRRGDDAGGEGESPPELSAADAARLERDLARYEP